MMIVESLIVVKREKYELASLCKETVDDRYAWRTVCVSDKLENIPVLFKENFLYNFLYAQWDKDFFDLDITNGIDKKPFLNMEDIEAREKPLLQLINNLTKEENVIQRKDLREFLITNLDRIWDKQNYANPFEEYGIDFRKTAKEKKKRN